MGNSIYYPYEKYYWKNAIIIITVKGKISLENVIMLSWVKCLRGMPWSCPCLDITGKCYNAVVSKISLENAMVTNCPE
jgi:hypothetical protein